ncbi:MAG: DNA mismatch repair endonuclease MutL [Spirochaetes bacterium]|nr:DNA mismatch repair endonuclease MutL [Spirochaetota bacterium]
MTKIISLPPEIYNRIAAGEVIENPASVVKELVENSLDAHASEIKIIVQNGGKKEITVMDNGEGMSEDDALLAMKKHTTSKIRDLDDLNHIHTFGFRGEALSSMVSVAQMEIKTRTKESDAAVKFFIEPGGKKIKKDYGPSETGTTVRVLNLFHNTPARLKFLKSDATEIKYIKETVTAIALAHYDKKFELIIDNKNDITLYRSPTILDRIREIFGRELGEHLIYLESAEDLFDLKGYVSKPSENRSTRQFQFLFLNQRPIKAKYFSYWISEGYKEMIPRSRYPFAFIFIDAASEFVDVNVHPAKKEVRFLNEYFLGNRLIKAIRSLLTPATGISQVHLDVSSGESPKQKTDIQKESIKESVSRSLFQYEKKGRRPAPVPDFEQKTTFIKENYFTLFNTYIFYEKNEDEILIVDQHAAHERVIYERIKRAVAEKNNMTQSLLIPLNISLSPAEQEVLKSSRDILKQIGFEFEEFGQNTMTLQGVPSYIRHMDDRQLFLDIMGLIMENKKVDPVTIKEEIMKEMACKSAVKAGDYLSKEQKEILLQDLLEDESRFTCPHGRPAVVRISKKEIEKWFHRS